MAGSVEDLRPRHPYLSLCLMICTPIAKCIVLFMGLSLTLDLPHAAALAQARQASVASWGRRNRPLNKSEATTPWLRASTGRRHVVLPVSCRPRELLSTGCLRTFPCVNVTYTSRNSHNGCGTTARATTATSIFTTVQLNGGRGYGSGENCAMASSEGDRGLEQRKHDLRGGEVVPRALVAHPHAVALGLGLDASLGGSVGVLASAMTAVEGPAASAMESPTVARAGWNEGLARARMRSR